MSEKKITGGGQAMDAPRGSYFKADPFDCTIVGIDIPGKRGDLCFDPQVLEGPPHQARTRDRQREFDELVDSLQQDGTLHNTVVVKDGDRFLVNAGRNRTLAAREVTNRQRAQAGLPPRSYGDLRNDKDPLFRIPVRLLDSATDARIHRTMLSENTKRVSRTPTAMAQDILDCYELRGYDDEQVRHLFNIPPTVNPRTYTKILSLTTELREAVDSGAVSVSSGILLADKSRAEQNDALEKHQSGEAPLTAARARSIKKGTKSLAPKRALLTKLTKDKSLRDDLRGLLLWALTGDTQALDDGGLTSFILPAVVRATAPKAKKAKAPKAKAAKVKAAKPQKAASTPSKAARKPKATGAELKAADAQLRAANNAGKAKPKAAKAPARQRPPSVPPAPPPPHKRTQPPLKESKPKARAKTPPEASP